MNILLIGDITGRPGRDIVKELIPKIKQEHKIDFIIANAENAAGGSGITPPIAEELLDAGINVITSGDHIWKKKEIFEIIDIEQRLLRPANFPENTPGSGSGIFKIGDNPPVAVLNLQGRIFMEPIDCPFRSAISHIRELEKETKIIIVDMHAEATSEKVAMGWYLDGLVSCVFGTHTHVQTADEKILPKGAAYITDLGMTGPFDSVIGRRKEQILERFISRLPVRFEMAEDDVRLNGAVLEVDEATGKALSIKRLQIKRN